MNHFYVLPIVTITNGKKHALELKSFDTLDAAKEFIASAQNSRARWDNDGFNRKVEYVVRYGHPLTGWDAQEYVVEFGFDDDYREYINVRDYFRITGMCGCASDKDHSRNKRDALCI